MSSYLAQHPEVCFATVKEPNYLAPDLDVPKPASEAEYLGLFNPSERTKILGEGSVLYLYSKTAAKRISEYSEDPRILMILRNPIAAAHSWYAQMRFTANEPLTTFEEALEAEADRKAGRRLPGVGLTVTCPQLLYYTEVYKYAEQVERYLNTFSPDHLMIVSYDDFQRDWRAVFKEVCGFLGVDATFEPVERNINAPRARRSWRTHYWLKKLFAAPARKTLPLSVRNTMIKAIDRVNTQSAERDVLQENTKTRLAEIYLPDLERLSTLLGRDYTRWCAATKSAVGAR